MLRSLATIICVGTYLVFAAAQLAAAAEAPPNILVFIGDDIGAADYGCYGNPAIRTPHIDALARQGLLFRNAFLTTSSCSPSRISILTGKYPHQTGAEDLHMPLPPEETFVSTILNRERSYFTGHMQKTHYGPNGVRQFQWYSKGLNEFPEFLDAADGRPFFMWVGFSDAHRPYSPGAVDPPHDPQQVLVPPFLADTPETRADIALYYDEISRMDENIGRMVGELKRRGMFENTLIVFIGDNGMPFPRAKGTAYDSGIGTPLVVTWPNVVAPGKETQALASVIDLAPTFLDAAGLEKGTGMEGETILPLLKNPSQPGREFIFAERNWHNADEHIRTVRTRRYKLIRNAYLELPFGHPSDCSSCPSWDALLRLKKEGKLQPEQLHIFRAPRPEWELYDMEADPWEFTNLAGSRAHAEVEAELRQVLQNWREVTNDFEPTERRRADNVDRVTGEKFTSEIGPLVNEGEPELLQREPGRGK